MNRKDFPAGFLFGTATSAYQIEGGWDADGKGPSIWDDFCRRPGRIAYNHDGDAACHTYFDYQTDVELMRRLGVGAYRFSVSWPRVIPEGQGAINAAGLDYYDRLTDALLEADIVPFITLFHWDLPLALHRDMGGFESRDCAAHFADYAEVVARRLGDRVKHWITINEPWVHATLGHLRGMHAPGRRNPWAYAAATHHQLLGHGLALERLKSLYPDSQVGLSLNLAPIYALRSDDERDRHAARMVDQFINRLYLDPLFRGRYPNAFWQALRRFHPQIRPEDMAIISRPVDFLGVNYYTRTVVRYAWYVPVLRAFPVQSIDAPAPLYRRVNGQFSQMGWEVYPAGLFETLWRLKTEYGNPPIYVTENGVAYEDAPVDGRVPDPLRQEYLEQHIAVVGAALKGGVDVRGYFVWSLLDNFEWSYGYNRRFGLVYVDFDTQRRTIKDSGYWYQAFLTNN